MKWLFLALAGASGTLARYWLAGAVNRSTGIGFPWGTAIVNLLGCLSFGLILGLTEERWAINSQTRSFLLIGFLGAFTTFSTFEFETLALLRDGEILRAFGNFGLQVGGGFLALAGGMVCGRLV